MALIVAPSEGFDSLVSLAYANDYASKMGYGSWAGTDSAKESALRRATQYLLARYRIKARYLDPVHKNVADACCESALRSLTGDLYTDVAASAVTSESVGPISVSYAAPVNGGQTRFAIIDDLLRGLLDGGEGMVKLIRA